MHTADSIPASNRVIISVAPVDYAHLAGFPSAEALAGDICASHAAGASLLEREAAAAGRAIEIETVINEPAFAALLAGKREEHERLVHAEMDKLAQRVDAIVLGQISLAQIMHRPPVPVLQVGHSGFAHARRLLDQVGAAKAAGRQPARV